MTFVGVPSGSWLDEGTVIKCPEYSSGFSVLITLSVRFALLNILIN
jgi:hypothetical protein